MTSMSPPETSADLRLRLAAELRCALSRRDEVSVAALRSALAAIANAEAVSAPPTVARTSSPHFAAASAGVGSAEAARRSVSEAAAAAIVRAEVDERQLVARQYTAAGYVDRAARLQAEADVLLAVLAGIARPG